MPWPKCGRFSISVTRRSGLADLSRCAASTTPLAPPPTIIIELARATLMRARSGSGENLLRRRKLVPRDRKVVDDDVAHFGQRALVEHLGDGLPDLEHQMSDLACRLIAVFTALILGAAGARNRRERPVEHAHDMADLDLVGRARQAIAAFLALAALDEPGIAQFAQNGVEEFLRNVVAAGDVADEGELTDRQLRQVDQRLEAVLTLFGE